MRPSSYEAVRDARAERTALRDGVLRCGRLLGWPTSTVIDFTEQIACRPWKRCTRAELADALDELHAVVWAFEVRKNPPLAALVGQAAASFARGGRHARRT